MTTEVRNQMEIKQLQKKIDRHKRLRDSSKNPLDIKYHFNIIFGLQRRIDELECMI